MSGSKTGKGDRVDRQERRATCGRPKISAQALRRVRPGTESDVTEWLSGYRRPRRLRRGVYA